MTQPMQLLDSTYFSNLPWTARVKLWGMRHPGAFVGPNEVSIRKRLADSATAPRAVVNIWQDALCSFLRDGEYRNVYDNARIGGRAPEDKYRVRVDTHLGLGTGTYFAAVSIGGSGVRYFGEYCMVLCDDVVDDATQLLDRDSFDTLYPPLDKLSADQVKGMLLGTWANIDDMILMRVLPRIGHDLQVVTSGTIIELALTDQEYIEIHLTTSFRTKQVAQVLESPESTATEGRILERNRRGLSNSMHEHQWARRKAELASELDRLKITQRVVTQHGRGYQWT